MSEKVKNVKILTHNARRRTKTNCNRSPESPGWPENLVALIHLNFALFESLDIDFDEKQCREFIFLKGLTISRRTYKSRWIVFVFIKMFSTHANVISHYNITHSFCRELSSDSLGLGFLSSVMIFLSPLSFDIATCACFKGVCCMFGKV